MLSVHTSPLDQPGTGDAGGMNVYVVELARRLAELGTEVEIFTRTTSRDLAPVVQLVDGVSVRHIDCGPYDGLTKDDLPAQLCTFVRGALRAEAATPGRYDLVHSHYWLSGQVGAVVSERWGVPLVHAMHTMAKVKNAYRASDDAPEPPQRILGEEQVVAAADLLLANTDDEAKQLHDMYAAPTGAVAVVEPGVDLELFRPGDSRAARRALGLDDDALVITFAGRLQPLKAPDVMVKAAACLLDRRPELRDRLTVSVIGGPSGSGLDRPHALIELAAELGVADVVSFVPPVGRARLAEHFRASTLACVPSYNESFGLVAIEAQACGAPVVAANVGGLPTAVRDGVSGLLVDGHDPRDYARTWERLLDDQEMRGRLSLAAIEHAQRFGWQRTAGATLDAYALARRRQRAAQTASAQ